MIFNGWFAIHCVMSHNLFSMAGKIFITFNYLMLETGCLPERWLVYALESNSSTASQSYWVLNSNFSFAPRIWQKHPCDGMKENGYLELRQDFSMPLAFVFPPVEVKLTVTINIICNTTCAMPPLTEHASQIRNCWLIIKRRANLLCSQIKPIIIHSSFSNSPQLFH